MANPTARQVGELVLKLLPPDGTPVLNRVMRVMLARELAGLVSPELYVKACDTLVDQGKIGRSRGQGGQIFYVAPDAAPTSAPTPDTWLEARLMAPLQRYLEGAFRSGLTLPDKSVFIVQDTSKIGPTLGRWARPDFILITAMRFRLLPGSQLDLHSFELKSETGATDLAVYEALAQTRFTHFGHLVWHLPRNSRAESRLPDIERQCDEHGIGLILMREPDKPESYEIALDPVRKATRPAEIDGFLETRLNDADRRKLLDLLNGAPAWQER
jgi:hypothetical protein